jgi:hypothetical protein
MPMIMFSGLLYKRESVPPYLAWMEKISIVNYSFSALLVEQASPSDGVYRSLQAENTRRSAHIYVAGLFVRVYLLRGMQ